MSEPKKPEPGEYWGTVHSARAAIRIIGFDGNECVVRHRDGRLTTLASGNWKQTNGDWKHLPWCTSFDDTEPVAEVWPKYFVGNKWGPTDAFVRYDRPDFLGMWVRSDGSESQHHGWYYHDAKIEADRVSWREVTESEALARLTPKCPEPQRDSVVEIDDSVLAMIATPTAISVNGSLLGRITGIEFGILGPDVKQKLPVARQHIGITVEAIQILGEEPVTPKCPDCGELAGEGHADVCPMAWVTQDRVPPREEYDQRRWVPPFSNKPSEWGVGIGLWSLRHGDKNANGTLEVRCRRKDLPPLPEPVKETRRISLRVFVPRRVLDDQSTDWPIRVTRGEIRDVATWVEVHGLNVYVEAAE